MGRRAGHDLTIEVTAWEATATVNPADAGSSSVSVTIDVDSLAVREGAGGVKPLTDGDRAEIQRVVRQEILHTERHPTITFRSTRVRGTPEAFVIEGELTIRDVTQPVTVRGAVDGAGGGRVRGSATVTQSRFGIKPYSAFFGALKLADDVEVSFDLTLPAQAA
ncbi:MAG TPA: YceI family protein [Streptosporangiaceae bacterium]